MVGTGGCARRVGTSWWNLYYRLTPPAWGRGLAADWWKRPWTPRAPSTPTCR